MARIGPDREGVNLGLLRRRNYRFQLFGDIER